MTVALGAGAKAGARKRVSVGEHDADGRPGRLTGVPLVTAVGPEHDEH